MLLNLAANLCLKYIRVILKSSLMKNMNIVLGKKKSLTNSIFHVRIPSNFLRIDVFKLQ